MRYTNNKKLLFAFVCGFFVQWVKKIVEKTVKYVDLLI